MRHVLGSKQTWLAAGAALALLAGLGPAARADVYYGFSTQALNGLAISANGLTITPGLVTVGTNNFAQVGGTLGGQIGTTDALQAYVGVPVAPSENFFGAGNTYPSSVVPPYSNLSAAGTNGVDGSAFANFAAPSLPVTANGLDSNGIPAGNVPVSLKSGALANFARGDSLISGTPSNIFGSGITLINVAESYLNTTESAQAQGKWTITARFSTGGVTTDQGTLHVAPASFTNAVYAYATDTLAYATANYSLDLTLSTLSGLPLGDQHADPLAFNHTQTALANLPEYFLSPGASGSDFSIFGGSTYQLQITGTETVSLITAVPEPGPMALAGLAIGGLGVLAGLRRWKKDKTVA